MISGPRIDQFPFARQGLDEGGAARLSRGRLGLVALAAFALIGVMTGRLVVLTLVQGASFRVRADENRILVRPLRATRGVILGRHDDVLVRNIPVTQWVDLVGDDAGPIETEGIGRSYPFADLFAHAMGYVGDASPEDLDACSKGSPDCSLDPGDVVGKSGLERAFDATLRGQDGNELVEVDANGTLVRVLSTEPPIPGKQVVTSLDVGLQRAASAALRGRRGAVIAIDPLDGSVFALVSSPSFDPNVFGQAMSNEQKAMNDEHRRGSNEEEIRKLLSDTVNRPLFNRAVGGEYPPGSLFKLVTASAGLEEGTITAETTIEDTGEIRIGEFRYGNWYFDQYGRTEGVLQLPRAITRSNDVFFYKVGEWVGPDLLAQWAKRLGLGEKTGIDTTSEGDGLVPDPLWKERTIGEPWFLGNTYHMAIGQGDVRVTPLQAAVMAGAVVTGRRCTPYLVQKTPSFGKADDQTNGQIDKWISRSIRQFVHLSTHPFIHSSHAFASTSTCQEVGLSDEHRALILQGMVGACSTGGTGFPFFPWNETGDPAVVACKTGTAQHGGEETKPHAWIVVTGPVKKSSEFRVQSSELYELDVESDKRIVLAVLLEEAGEGSAEAGPVAKEILEKWFSE